MRALLFLAAILAIPCAHAEQGERMLFPFVWTDVTGTRDMPWVGASGRARWLKRDVTKPTDIMNPRGPTIETRWGASASSGESPWDTGDRAADYLEKVGMAKEWPCIRRSRADRRTAPSLSRDDRRIQPDRDPSLRPSATIEDPIEFSFGASGGATRRQLRSAREQRQPH
jgi:hypothetical protein